MKKWIIITSLYIYLLCGKVFSYSIDEWALIVEKVKESLDNTVYSFVDNIWSSWKSSYHIFVDWKMVWYIYASDNWISMWSWWQENGEVWTFFSKKEFSEKDILNFFHELNKGVLISSIEDNNISQRDNNIYKKENLFVDFFEDIKFWWYLLIFLFLLWWYNILSKKKYDKKDSNIEY